MSEENKDNILEFICEINREVFSSEDYKIYGVDVDINTYKGIELNKYGNATIVGNFHTLTEGVEYSVKAKESNSKYGKQYEVFNIKREKPTSKAATEQFLREVITENQANTLLEVYPDIVNKVVSNDLDDIDLELTKGIKEKTFDKIKEKIIENFALVEVVEKYGGYGLSMSMLKKLYKEYASIERLEKALQNDPYKSLCKISGIGFKKADGIILSIPSEMMGKSGDIKSSKERMLSAMHYILEENEKDGNTKMSILDFRKECTELTPQAIEHFVDLVKEDRHFYFNAKDKIIASKYAYETEKYIASKLKLMLKNNIKYKFNYNVYQDDGDIKLTGEQLGALKNLCEYNVSLLAGFAGSGKTSTVKAILNMLDDNNITSLLLTPTGKSSDVLAKSSNRESSTIHRGLGFNPENNPKWLYNEENQLKCDVVIVDETGMVDITLLQRLLKAINPLKTKILMIQDPAQLPSVSAGNCSDDMIRSGIVPTTTLSKIFRYGEGGLYNVATKVREGKYYIPKSDKSVINFGDNKDYSVIDMDQENMVDGIVNLYESLIDQGNTPDDIVVLSHHNKGDYGSVLLNNKIQARINPIDEYTKHLTSKGTNFIVGDKVLQVVNNYKAETILGLEAAVFNGNTGVIQDIDTVSEEAIIEFDGVLLRYGKEDLNQLLLGYAMSIHKCVAEGTLIQTNEGLKKIEDLSNGTKYNEKSKIINNIKVFNGNYLESPSHFINSGVRDCLEIRTNKNYKIECTLDHGLDVLTKDGDIVRMDATDINIGDHVLLNKGGNIYGNNVTLDKKHILDDNKLDVRAERFKQPFTIDKEFAKFMGMMVADGTISHGGIKLAKRYLEVVEEFQRLVRNIFGHHGGNIVKLNHCNAHILEVNSVFIRDFCKSFPELNSYNKDIPKCIMNAPLDIQIAFLSGYMEDGTVNNKEGIFQHIEISAKGLPLINNLRYMLLNMGVVTSFREIESVSKNEVNPHYILHIYKSDSELMYDLGFSFISKFKQDRFELVKTQSSFSQSSVPYVCGILEEILDSLPTQPKKWVYDRKRYMKAKRKNRITYKTLECFLSEPLIRGAKDGKLKKHIDLLEYLCYKNEVMVVEEIKKTNKQTYCLTMPKTNKFIQNGFSGWNCQGSSSKNVIVLMPKAHTYFLNRNLIYTAITRTRERCYHFVSRKTVKSALRKSIPHERQTFLKELLQIN